MAIGIFEAAAVHEAEVLGRVGVVRNGRFVLRNRRLDLTRCAQSPKNDLRCPEREALAQRGGNRHPGKVGIEVAHLAAAGAEADGSVAVLVCRLVSARSPDSPAEYLELRKQSRFLSDIVRVSVPTLTTPPQTLPAAVLNWNDRIIPRLAEAIYEARRLAEGTLDNAQLAILADALVAGGCDDEILIQHCRSEGPHVRGCWAVDLLLGKR